MHPTALRFRDRAGEAGLDVDVRELSESTRTAVEAADAVGCELGQIVKSVTLMDGDDPLLCLCAGDRRVAVGRLGDGVRMAKANEVREVTGYAIGGVPPVAHASKIPVYVDRDLRRYDLVYAAGGVPECVFPLTPDELIRVTGGHVADLRQEPQP